MKKERKNFKIQILADLKSRLHYVFFFFSDIILFSSVQQQQLQLQLQLHNNYN